MNGDPITAVVGNHLILKSIFIHISAVEDLKCARLVSKMWRDESLDRWRGTATLRLNWGAYETPTVQLHKYKLLALWQRSTELGDACPYQLAKTPFSHYRIDNLDLLHIGSVECRKLERFLNIFSPYMKYLHLNQSIILPEQYRTVLKWILCMKVSFLEEFEVYLPQKIPLPVTTDKVYWSDLDSSKAPVSKLRKMAIELGKCHYIGPPEFIPEKNTSISGEFFEGQSFPNLVHLCLLGESVISFRGLKSLTNLKVLWIESSPYISDWNRRIGNEAGREELYWGKLVHIHMDYFRFTPKTLEIFARWMPNLKKVELRLYGRTRGMIPQLWPNIEVVTDLTPGNENGLGDV